MSRSRNILLFGSNDRAALECCRSLGRAGHRVTILRLDSERSPADYSRYCSESLFIGSPDSGVREYLTKLRDLLRSRHYDYLLPVDDLSCELIYSDYEAISSSVAVVGPSVAAYAVSHNRFEALAVTETAGLERPATTLVKRGTSPPVPVFPCRVRPVVSCGVIDDELQSFSDREVRTLDELDAKLRDDLPRVDVMLQNSVAGEDVGLNFCAIDGDILGAAVTVHLHYPMRGTGDSYSKTEEVPSQTLSVMQNIARQLSWTGFMSIACKRTKGNLSIMELIGYPWDSLSLLTFAGVDFPKLLIDALEGRRNADLIVPTRAVFARHLQKDIRWLAQSVKARGFSTGALWLTSLGRLLTGRERLEFERIGDPLPAIRQFDRYLRRLSPGRSTIGANLSARSLQKTHSLLVVCQGNINRSVVAEHLFRARGFTSVRSAGLLGMSGRRPSKAAETFLVDHGIDASGLRSQSLSRALRDKQNVDMVLCFERKHIAEIVHRYPDLRGKVVLLSHLAGDSEGGPDIADPHGATAGVYLECFRRIEKLVDRVVS